MMITRKELELFEKKMQSNKSILLQGNKILAEMIRQIKDTAKSTQNDLGYYPDWDAYRAWDKD